MDVQIDRNKLITTYFVLFVLSLILGLSLSSFSQLNQQKVIISPFKTESPRQATANIVAVSSLTNTGVIGKTNVLIEKGTGKVLIETNPFVETDTQYSANTAKSVAEEYVGLSLKKYDVIYSYEIPAQVLGGPSAGAAMTVATIAAMENKTVKKDVVITGTINPDGTIGPIGGVLEKVTAAGENNMTLFLLPRGQSKITYYERQVENKNLGGFIFQNVYYVPKTLDVKTYAMQKFKMKVIEVNNINEAVSYMIK